MRSSSESFLCALIRFFSAVFCALPYRFNLAIARVLGRVFYYLQPKKRAVVEANLRTAFAGEMNPGDIHRLSKKVFESFICGVMDVFYLPKLKAGGFERIVRLKGMEHLDHALTQKRGCILLAIHSGSWELASIVGSMTGYAYNIVAKDQAKAPLLNELLNEYRVVAGAKVIFPGVATREILRVLKANEIVSLVADQGGEEGIAVDFFGKTASMSTGAIRIGLKYQTPICPVWIERQADGFNEITVFPALELPSSDDTQKDVLQATQRVTRFFEEKLRRNPSENMWFYKVYKYTTQSDVLILDDGKTGHLRQSEAVAESVRTVLAKQHKQMRLRTIKVDFKSRLRRKLFQFYAVFAQVLPFLRKEECLGFFLTTACYKELLSVKPDILISAGSQTAAVNFILSRLRSIIPIHVLTPGLLDWRWFRLVVIPEHDKPVAERLTRVLVTKAALNLIEPAYLKEQEARLLFRYSHLKNSVRAKMGVLIGGDTKGVKFDVHQMRVLIRQLKDAAEHYNMDLLVTTSRRSSAELDQMIAKELRNFSRCGLLILPNEANIPEAVGGILGLADLVVVSGESISMVSEAVSSGKKTIVFAPTGVFSRIPINKYERFVLGLDQQGYLLACSIKDLSMAITRMMSRKFNVKQLEDRSHLFHEIEGLLK